MDEILKDKIDSPSLTKKLKEFKSLLIRLSGLDLESQINKEDIQLENGMALNTLSAGSCIVDTIRTRQFIRGIHQAIKQIRQRKSGPIKILYAGTGPFATLVLPLLTKYNPDKLQLILLDINKQTISYLEQLIKQLRFEGFIEKIICADASKYKLENGKEIDILVSETMQHALLRELQVPIMLNLVPQLNEETIIIPNNIQLDLALMNSVSNRPLENHSEQKYKRLTTLWNFDKTFIQSFTSHNLPDKEKVHLELCKRFPFRQSNNREYNKLVILTSIQVYKTEWINVGSSGLTIPKVLLDLNSIRIELKEISLSYEVRTSPQFDFELN